jgi:hypothetical protein
MAITWDTSTCGVPVAQNDDETAQRDTLIFLAGMIDAGDLTADTLREWMVRVVLLERFSGMSPLFGSNEELREALRRWCGMTTNAMDIPRDEWIAGRITGMVEAVEGHVDNAIDEAMGDR